VNDEIHVEIRQPKENLANNHTKMRVRKPTSNQLEKEKKEKKEKKGGQALQSATWQPAAAAAAAGSGRRGEAGRTKSLREPPPTYSITRRSSVPLTKD